VLGIFARISEAHHHNSYKLEMAGFLMAEPVLNEEHQRILGRDAQRNNILAARVVAETVKTTLGPKGMDKMLVDRSGNVTITNDGVTILEQMEIEHPAAKMLVEVAKTQEKEVGDGTTTAVMIAGKLLENAEKLLDQKIHPTVITRGYRWASEESAEILKELAVELDSDEQLSKIAQTAMTGKGAEYLKEKFGRMVVETVKILSENKIFDPRGVRIEKKMGGSLEETALIKGIVLGEGRASKDMVLGINNARIALLEEALEVKGPETETRISVSNPDQLQNFLNQEEAMLRAKINAVLESGANVVFAQRGIDDYIKHYLAREGIYAVERVGREDLWSIAKATGAKIVSRLKELRSSDLGAARLVEERLEGDHALTYILGCEDPKSITILIRGGTSHVVEEVERAIRDALGDVASALKDSKIVAGGGAVEVELARRLRAFAKTLTGRERLAVEEFANALEFIPTALAENAGLDPLDVLTELRAIHDAGNKNHGINLFNENVEDSFKNGIIEPLKVKVQAISSASEVAIMILRIDDVIAAKKPRGESARLGAMSGYD